jgi:hypothetical protein
LLPVATAALLAGARSVSAIVPWGQLHPREGSRALGFTRGQMPASAPRQSACNRVEGPACEAVLQMWAAQALSRADRQMVRESKALRGIHGDEVPSRRLVAGYAPEAGLVLAPGGQDR